MLNFPVLRAIERIVRYDIKTYMTTSTSLLSVHLNRFYFSVNFKIFSNRTIIYHIRDLQRPLKLWHENYLSKKNLTTLAFLKPFHVSRSVNLRFLTIYLFMIIYNKYASIDAFVAIKKMLFYVDYTWPYRPIWYINLSSNDDRPRGPEANKTRASLKGELDGSTETPFREGIAEDATPPPGGKSFKPPKLYWWGLNGRNTYMIGSLYKGPVSMAVGGHHNE